MAKGKKPDEAELLLEIQGQMRMLARDFRDLERRLARMEDHPSRPAAGGGGWSDHFYSAQRELMLGFQDMADQVLGRAGDPWRGRRRRERIDLEPDAGDVQSWDWPPGSAYDDEEHDRDGMVDRVDAPPVDEKVEPPVARPAKVAAKRAKRGREPT